MPSTQDYHQQLRTLLAESNWEAAQMLWLDLTETLAAQPEVLLLLIRDFVDAGQPAIAAELARLLAPDLKTAGKLHEWLYALKLQANVVPLDKAVRAELLEAYPLIHQGDPRLKTILAAAELDQPRTPLPAAFAKVDTLLALSVGAYCQHKSWGFGRVKQFDATLTRLVVAFPHNPEHAFQLNYAAESLAPVNADHIEVRKVTDLPALKVLATNEPLALLRLALLSHNHAATPDRLEATLTPAIILAADWKKWWDNAKKLAKRDPHFDIPAKKTDPVVLRTAPVSQEDELLDAFRNARSLPDKTSVAGDLVKLVDDLKDPDLLVQEFQDGLLAALRTVKPEYFAPRLEAALMIDELNRHRRTATEAGQTLALDILNSVTDLPEVLDQLGSAAQKRALAVLRQSQSDRLLANLNQFPAKILDEIGDLLPTAGERISQLVQNHSARPELLVWLCRHVTSTAWLQPLQNPVLLLAILSALESGTAPERRKLRAALLDDETLLTDLLVRADTQSVRDLTRRLLNSPAFEELDRRSLMGRLVKEFPFVQEYLVTKTIKEQPLIVSRPSLHKRQAELEDIIQKRIPQNSKDIAQARSYGDLRENFEFKAAKEMQKVLMRRRAELEVLIVKAQPTDFTDVKTDAVGIGTTVTVTDLATGQPHTYHILGAWDSDTARGIVSYPAALAQTLFNKRVGDVVESASDTGQLQLRIDRIEKAPAEILQTL